MSSITFKSGRKGRKDRKIFYHGHLVTMCEVITLAVLLCRNEDAIYPKSEGFQGGDMFRNDLLEWLDKREIPEEASFEQIEEIANKTRERNLNFKEVSFMSKNSEFHGPASSKQEDEKMVSEAESFEKTDWSLVYWKPKANYENVIRILPGVGKATYHLKFGKHFIKHSDKTESFVCNRETYQEACPACEEYDRLVKANDEDASRFKVQTRGTFNVVDYSDEEAKVKLWEAPLVTGWLHIVKMVGSKSRFNNLVGTEENPLEGRDIIVFYDPDAGAQQMYRIQFDETTVIKPESAKKWLEAARPLVREEVYPKTDPEVAKIKMSGSSQEREALRKRLAEQQAQAAAPTEASKEAEKKAEPEVDEEAALKKRLAEIEAEKKAKSAEAKPAEANPETKPEPEKEKKNETPADVKAKVDEIRKKHQA